MRQSAELAIDLGTANTLVFQKGAGIILNQPTVVAMNARDGEVLALGEEAWGMIGRTPANIVAVRPLRHGAVTDYDITAQMLRLILRTVGVTRWSKPRTLVCVPSAITDVERRAVEEATKAAGARSVTLIEEPMAAAIGAGLPIHEPIGNLVVDVGGGTSEVAMVSMGGLISKRSVRVGGFDMDAVIQQHLRREYNLAIGERAAEHVKMTGGTAYPVPEATPTDVRGRDVTTGMPRELQLTQEEIREALSEPVERIVGTARECLADSPPELGHDVLERGMFLCGGGGMLRGLDMRISQECEVPVHLTETPLETVVLGAGRCLEVPEVAGLFAAWRL
ncbi:MAG TPA: rod shape-determining protein [Actinomycetota bacterium]|nr:rod shape-determining protein [Actinomycetota bacterium]